MEKGFAHLAVETVSGQSQLWATVGHSSNGSCRAKHPPDTQERICGQLAWTRNKLVGMQVNVCSEVSWKTALVSRWKEQGKGS